MPTPDVIVAYLDPHDVRVHVPEQIESGTPDEWYVWEDLGGPGGTEFLLPRLFEEGDGSRVISFQTDAQWSAGDVYDGIAYEWNIDTEHPDFSGWRPYRYAEPVDELPPQISKLQHIMRNVSDLVLSSSYIEARAVAAAADADEGAWDTASELDDLIEWLSELQSSINQRFSQEWDSEIP